MYPTTFHPKEELLQPPKGQHEEISSLRVVRVLYEGGVQGCISCWQLTPDEMALIQKTGKIYVSVLALQQPPILPAVNPEDVGLPE